MNKDKSVCTINGNDISYRSRFNKYRLIINKNDSYIDKTEEIKANIQNNEYDYNIKPTHYISLPIVFEYEYNLKYLKLIENIKSKCNNGYTKYIKSQDSLHITLILLDLNKSHINITNIANLLNEIYIEWIDTFENNPFTDLVSFGQAVSFSNHLGLGKILYLKPNLTELQLQALSKLINNIIKTFIDNNIIINQDSFNILNIKNLTSAKDYANNNVIYRPLNLHCTILKAKNEQIEVARLEQESTGIKAYLDLPVTLGVIGGEYI